MKRLSTLLLITTTLALAACGDAGKQWLDPDKSFSLFDQPEVKGINDTQEDMAKVAFNAGDYGRAAQFYQQLIAGKKAAPEQLLRYKLGMAEATRRLGDNETALAMYDELSRDQAKNVDVMEGRGLCLMALGKSVDAGRVFSDVIEKDPKRWRSLNALGILFVTKNMIPEAMAYYTEALNNSPDNAAVLNNVGLSQAADRNFSRAKEALEQAARMSKSPAQKKQIELNLAMVLGISGNMEGARELANKYFEGPALDNNLGLYAHLAKDDNLARTYLNMALTQSPTYYERAWQNLDVVGDENMSGVMSKPRTTELPKLELLQKPEAPVAAPAPAPASVAVPAPIPIKPSLKPRTRKHSAKPVSSMPRKAAPTLKPAAPAMLPEVSADQPVSAPAAAPVPVAPTPAPTQPAPAKSVDKPAGLIVGPGE